MLAIRCRQEGERMLVGQGRGRIPVIHGVVQKLHSAKKKMESNVVKYVHHRGLPVLVKRTRTLQATHFSNDGLQL